MSESRARSGLPRGLGTHYKVPPTEISDARLAAHDRPGAHIWVMTAAWRIADPAKLTLDHGPVIMDAENIIMFAGPGCLKCELPWTPGLEKVKCGGSVSDSIGDRF